MRAHLHLSVPKYLVLAFRWIHHHPLSVWDLPQGHFTHKERAVLAVNILIILHLICDSNIPGRFHFVKEIVSKHQFTCFEARVTL